MLLDLVGPRSLWDLSFFILSWREQFETTERVPNVLEKNMDSWQRKRRVVIKWKKWSSFTHFIKEDAVVLKSVLITFR